MELLWIQLPAIADDVDLAKGHMRVWMPWHSHLHRLSRSGLLLLLLLASGLSCLRVLPADGPLYKVQRVARLDPCQRLSLSTWMVIA